jgi:hypothetical protein
MLIGPICLGIAVFRARVLPKWVGVAMLVSPVLGAAGLPGIAGLASDFTIFAALLGVGVYVLRTPAVSPVPSASATLSPLKPPPLRGR